MKACVLNMVDNKEAWWMFMGRASRAWGAVWEEAQKCLVENLTSIVARGSWPHGLVRGECWPFNNKLGMICRVGMGRGSWKWIQTTYVWCNREKGESVDWCKEKDDVKVTGSENCLWSSILNGCDWGKIGLVKAREKDVSVMETWDDDVEKFWLCGWIRKLYLKDVMQKESARPGNSLDMRI